MRGTVERKKSCFSLLMLEKRGGVKAYSGQKQAGKNKKNIKNILKAGNTLIFILLFNYGILQVPDSQ